MALAARITILAAASLSIACPVSAPLPPSASPPRTRPGARSLPLELEIVPDPLRPAPLFSLSGALLQLHFHLNLKNLGARTIELQTLSFTSRRAGLGIATLELGQPLLARRLRATAVVVVRDRQSLALAARTRFLLARPKGDTRIAPGETVSLVHQVTLHRPEDLPDAVACRLMGVVDEQTASVERVFPVVALAQRTRLSLPVQGRWWVMAAHRFDEDHAEAAIASQRFAYDLGVLGPGLTSYRGDPRRVSSYLASGRPILAAADGVVVAVHDGVGENEPVGSRPSWRDVQRQPADLAGNFVVLRHEGEEHTAYLHLQPGLTLRPGVRVRRGDTIGRCGNSGNSRESHLHLQLQDGPDPIRASALPPRFGDFTIFLGGLRLYVPAERPQPLPRGYPIEPGRAEGAEVFAR